MRRNRVRGVRIERKWKRHDDNNSVPVRGGGISHHFTGKSITSRFTIALYECYEHNQYSIISK